MKLKVKVSQLEGRRGPVRNQFVIHTDEGKYFQSYDSIIAFVPRGNGQVLLDKDYWHYSRTTDRYRVAFLGEHIKETREKIKLGIYKLTNLN